MNPIDLQQPNPHDRAIDATLAALRQAAQPPAGLENKVLQSLAASTDASHMGRRIAWVAVPVLACAALFFLAIPALRHPRSAPDPMASNTRAFQDLMPVTSPTLKEQLPTRKVPTRQPSPVRAHRIAVAREDSLVTAHSDTPPPPTPLTEQERLLLQIAHAGDPSQRAMLNPEVLAREESDEDAQFRNFFAKLPAVQTKNP